MVEEPAQATTQHRAAAATLTAVADISLVVGRQAAATAPTLTLVATTTPRTSPTADTSKPNKSSNSTNDSTHSHRLYQRFNS